MPTELISVYIENNVWDLLFALGIDLAVELPKDEFCVCITREAEFEIPPIEESRPELKAFIEKTIRECSIATDIFFGFSDDSLPAEEQRVGGFDVGRWAQPEELAFLDQQRTSLGALRAKTRLYKNEADRSLAARAFTGVVLSLDTKKGPINEAYKQGGRVVFLTDFDQSGLSLSTFIKRAIAGRRVDSVIFEGCRPMFENANDLAEAAIRLLSLADHCIEIGQYENAGTLELSAAALAVHVADWHVQSREASPEDKRAFATFSREWDLLREIVNGIKHPKGRNGRAVERQPEWEDPDFWEKSALPGELIVQDGEEWCSVQSLIIAFCELYKARTAPIGSAG